MSQSGFRASLRRQLIARIGIAAAILALVFTALTFVTERERMEEAVLVNARAAAARWNVEIESLLDDADRLAPGALQPALDSFVAKRGEQSVARGRFILVRVHGLTGRRLAELEDESFAGLEKLRAIIDAAGFQPPTDRDYRVLSARLAGQSYIGVQLALTDSNGAIRAWLGGAFALSPAEQTRLRGDLLRTVFYVFLIVCATSLLLLPVITQLLGRLARLTDRLLDANLETLQVLGSAIAKRDSDTDAHNYRVTVYSVRLAEAAGLTASQIQSLIKGALLHDVGKLGIRDKVLLKPGKLDEDEFAIMRTHVEHGLDITARASWLHEAREVVGAHHEKYGGQGYPSGLAGEDIPVNARIFAIADVFDALTSRRPYKEPLSYDETMQILEEGRDHHFDPRLLDLFGGIARKLYDEFGGRDGDEARQELGRLIERYFRGDVSILMREAGAPPTPAAN
ncbi:MAG: HD-GYP domain-containing protein [Gammaproteobacteria bacterium]|nr:HD-GYP domain-containing protein [Gammaproteobacteria bacterium]